MNTNNFSPTQIHLWINEVLKFVTLAASQHIHIDELAKDRNLSNQELVELGIKAFDFAAAYLMNLDMPVKLFLIIPLIAGKKKLSFKFPKTYKELLVSLDIEPPSLYLIDWKTFGLPSTYEQYKKPVNIIFPVALASDVNIFYKETRNSYLEEFQRAVYIELM